MSTDWSHCEGCSAGLWSDQVVTVMGRKLCISCADLEMRADFSSYSPTYYVDNDADTQPPTLPAAKPASLVNCYECDKERSGKEMEAHRYLCENCLHFCRPRSR